jgi:hypothetical protein
MQEVRDLKNDLRIEKENKLNVFYNQMVIGEQLSLSNLNHIFIDRLDTIENIDELRTDAIYLNSSFDTDVDGLEKVIYTNDFILNSNYGDFTIYAYKTDINLSVKCFISNEVSGEHFLEASKQNEKTIDGLIEETFSIKKSRNNRVRIKFIIEKVDVNSPVGTIEKFSIIYQ